MRKQINTFDLKTTAWVQRLPVWAQMPMVVASFIGSPGVVIAVGGLSVALTYYFGQSRVGLALLASLLAFGTIAVLKRILRRVRPDTPYVKQYQLLDYSFPSGHSSGALLLYGLLAYVSYTHLSSPWSAVSATILGFTALLVGISRVYLGAHYPTDVLGAWVVSSAYLVLIVNLVGI